MQARVSKAAALVITITSMILVFASPLVLGAELAIQPGDIVQLEDAEELEIHVIINEADSLTGYNMNLLFNPHVLEVLDVREQGFLRSAGPTEYFTGPIDNTVGSIASIGDHLHGSSNLSSSGVLFSVTFRIKDVGSIDLELHNARLYDEQGHLIEDVKTAKDNYAITERSYLRDGRQVKQKEIVWQAPSGLKAFRRVTEGSGEIGAIGPKAWSMYFWSWEPQIEKLINDNFFIYCLALIVIAVFIFMLYKSNASKARNEVIPKD